MTGDLWHGAESQGRHGFALTFTPFHEVFVVGSWHELSEWRADAIPGFI